MTVDKLCASYLYKRDGTYYFSEHVPYDVEHHYRCKRIVMSLRTKMLYVHLENVNRYSKG